MPRTAELAALGPAVGMVEVVDTALPAEMGVRGAVVARTAERAVPAATEAGALVPATMAGMAERAARVWTGEVMAETAGQATGPGTVAMAGMAAMTR